MRVRSLLVPTLAFAAAAAAIIGCHFGSGGDGSAPPPTDPCPATLADLQAAQTAGASCNGPTSSAPRVCCYLGAASTTPAIACGDVTTDGAPTTETVAYCPGGYDPETGKPQTWTVETTVIGGAIEAGTDADAADASDASDTAPEADAADANDAADAEADAADASDAADANDAAVDAADAD